MITKLRSLGYFPTKFKTIADLAGELFKFVNSPHLPMAHIDFCEPDTLIIRTTGPSFDIWKSSIPDIEEITVKPKESDQEVHVKVKLERMALKHKP
jgi:hypothetical protein